MPWDARRISIVSETSEPRDPHKVNDAPSDEIDALTPLTLTPLHFTPRLHCFLEVMRDDEIRKIEYVKYCPSKAGINI